MSSKDNKTEINLTNTNSTISSMTNSSNNNITNTNYLFNQDSFISLINPERTNDSTLVGNHHTQCHLQATNKNKCQQIIKKSSANSVSVGNSRNTLIQTTPTECANFRHNDVQAQMNTSLTTTVTTTTMSSSSSSSTTTAADILAEENKMLTTSSSLSDVNVVNSNNSNNSSDENKTAMTRSSLSSSDLTAATSTTLASQINVMTAQLLLNNQNSKLEVIPQWDLSNSLKLLLIISLYLKS